MEVLRGTSLINGPFSIAMFDCRRVYPLAMTNIAIEYGHRKSEFPKNSMVDLSIVMFVYQRVARNVIELRYMM